MGGAKPLLREVGMRQVINGIICEAIHTQDESEQKFCLTISNVLLSKHLVREMGFGVFQFVFSYTSYKNRYRILLKYKYNIHTNGHSTGIYEYNVMERPDTVTK